MQRCTCMSHVKQENRFKFMHITRTLRVLTLFISQRVQVHLDSCVIHDIYVDLGPGFKDNTTSMLSHLYAL